MCVRETNLLQFINNTSHLSISVSQTHTYKHVIYINKYFSLFFSMRVRNMNRHSYNNWMCPLPSLSIDQVSYIYIYICRYIHINLYIITIIRILSHTWVATFLNSNNLSFYKERMNKTYSAITVRLIAQSLRLYQTMNLNHQIKRSSVNIPKT